MVGGVFLCSFKDPGGSELRLWDNFSLAFLATWIMALPSSHTSQVAESPPSVQKRRRDSSSSGSSSSTVKAVSKRFATRKRPVAKTLREKRAKKRSKLTGLSNNFYVEPRQTIKRLPSRINIKAQRSLDIGASDTAKREFVSSSDSEACRFVTFAESVSSFPQGDDELVKQALQLDTVESPSVSSETSITTGSVRGVV